MEKLKFFVEPLDSVFSSQSPLYLLQYHRQCSKIKRFNKDMESTRLTQNKSNLLGRGYITTIYGRGFLFCFTFLVVCLIPSIFYAFSEADLARLLSTQQCRFCNLHSADLSGAQLSGAQLSNASLSHAKLSNANLSRANLSGAFLTNANLSGANLSDAYLANANLSNADLSGANLSGADLSGAIWTNGSKCEKGSNGECKLSNLLGEPK
jgi:uncharacterized protein YjbI with pentapeptide repeats